MRQRRLLSIDEYEFEDQLLDGRKIRVVAYGKVHMGAGWSPAFVTDLSIEVWAYRDEDDMDGIEIFQRGYKSTWDRLETKAAELLIEHVLDTKSQGEDCMDARLERCV